MYRVTWQPAVSVRVLWPKGKQLLSIWLKIFMKQFIISSLREIVIATHSMPVINPRDKLSVVDGQCCITHSTPDTHKSF